MLGGDTFSKLTKELATELESTWWTTVSPSHMRRGEGGERRDDCGCWLPEAVEPTQAAGCPLGHLEEPR